MNALLVCVFMHLQRKNGAMCGKLAHMERKTNFLRHLSGVFDLSPRPYHLDRHGFATDARNLRGDSAAFVRDLRKQLRREPSDKRARKE
jgi:hypothetical protein